MIIQKLRFSYFFGSVWIDFGQTKNIECLFRPQIHPQIHPQGTKWGLIWDIPYLWIKLDQISFEWTFLANDKIEMPNFIFGDDLDPKFIPKRIQWR